MKLTGVNILMLGAKEVGKSALTVRLLTKRFIGEYKSEGDSIYSHTVDLSDIQYYVTVLDTCSKSGNSRNLQEQIRWADAVALVYDVSSCQSFDIVHGYLQQLSRRSNSLPTVILANKFDLHPDAHAVDPQEAKKVAEEYECKFFEVSAADDWVEVSRAFGAVIRLAELGGNRRRSLLSTRRGSLTRHVAQKVLQVVQWSPKKERRPSSAA